MDVDIYGDLDNLDNQFDVVKQENEQLKATVQKLEETSIKFSIEINDLRRINTSLETNISSLFKTAKTEIERKNKQITELRKDVDNMVFKRGIQKTFPDNRNKDLQDKDILSKKFEKALHDLEQKNRIINTLNTELDDVRKQLEQKNNAFKRNSSQIEQDHGHNFDCSKKPKLEKETLVGNEEEYRNYRNRSEMRDSGQHGSRSKSPHHQRYNSRQHNDLRSRLDLKRINYRHSRSQSREDFYADKRFNRQTYRNAQFKGKYTDRPDSPMDYDDNYRFYHNDQNEKQNKECDSGIFNSQMTENSDLQGNIGFEPRLDAAYFFDDGNSNQLEEGELNNTNVITDEIYCKTKSTDSRKVPEKTKTDRQKTSEVDFKITISKSSLNKIEKSVAETINNNTTVVCDSKQKQGKADLENHIIIEKKLKHEVKKDKSHINNKLKLPEEKKENLTFSTTESSSKTDAIKDILIETPKSANNKSCEPLEECIINNKDTTEKRTTKNEKNTIETKPSAEVKPTKDRKGKSKLDKIKVEVVSDKRSESKSSKSTKKTEPKTSKSKKQKEIKTNDTTLAESKSTNSKIETTISNVKDTNISIVSESIPTKNREKAKVSESVYANISIVVAARPAKSKKEKKFSESTETNISLVSEPQPTNIIIEKVVTESNDTNISFVIDSKIEKNTNSNEIENNTIKVKETDDLKPKHDASTTNKVYVNLSEIANIAESKCKSVSKNILNNLHSVSNVPESKDYIKSKPEILNEETTTNNELQKTANTVTEPNNRNPPIRGRRRRCIISII